MKTKKNCLPDSKRILQLFSNLTHMLEQGDISSGEFDRFLKRQNPFRLKRDSRVRTRFIVDRTIHPIYPEWVQEVVHPELELSGYVHEGPYEDDCSALLFIHAWLHEDQINHGVMAGDTMYAYLKDNNMLKDCMSLRDAEEIYELGRRAFRMYFRAKTLFFWKSVVRHTDGSLHVPYISDEGSDYEFDWAPLDSEMCLG